MTAETIVVGVGSVVEVSDKGESFIITFVPVNAAGIAMAYLMQHYTATLS